MSELAPLPADAVPIVPMRTVAVNGLARGPC